MRLIGDNIMTNKKYFIWVSVGAILATLAALLVTMTFHAITWAPLLIEIASVTWNDAPHI
jgi:hypothetical protein